jgi:peptidoglycan hydrolase-like protein with peptidoglycan-binding domain
MNQLLESKKLTVVLLFIAFLILAVSPFLALAAVLTQTLDLGEKNEDVASLQTYLAKETAIYPEGLVTGYFGVLTQAAVQRFQVKEGIVTSGTPDTTGYGRVGPKTLTRLNVLMGGAVSPEWDTVPVLSNLRIATTSTSVTFTWNTNEVTRGEVCWSASPVSMNEATAPRQQPNASGTLALDGAGLVTAHSVTVSNLAPNTTYYYMVRSVDSVGNLSLIWPSSFQTGN